MTDADLGLVSVTEFPQTHGFGDDDVEHEIDAAADEDDARAASSRPATTATAPSSRRADPPPRGW